MKIVHVPSGLFPHIESGFERTPYLVTGGESVVIGCRLEGDQATCVLMEVRDSRGTHKITGECSRPDDGDRRYYRFVYKTDANDSAFAYRFLVGDEDGGRWYECPLLSEVILQPVQADFCDGGAVLTYMWQTARIVLNFRVGIAQTSFILL